MNLIARTYTRTVVMNDFQELKSLLWQPLAICAQLLKFKIIKFNVKFHSSVTLAIFHTLNSHMSLVTAVWESRDEEIPSSQKVLLDSPALAVGSMFILFHSLFTHPTVLTECLLCCWQCSQKNMKWLRAQTATAGSTAHLL